MKRLHNSDIDADIDSPSTKKKMIRIAKVNSPLRQLEIEIHESLHACLWDISEEAIEETARDVSRFLWRIGYVKRQDDESTEK